MKESNFSPEVQAILPEVVSDVSILILTGHANDVLPFQTPEEKLLSWQSVIGEYPPFTDKIQGLMKSLQDASVTKEAYHGLINNIYLRHFVGVKDQSAQMLLADILLARTISSPGYLSNRIDMQVEALTMYQELGIEGGFKSRQLEDLTLNQTVEALLTDTLKLTHPTKV